MFSISTSHVLQLLVVSLIGLSIFVISYSGIQRQILYFLIAIIPFQLIDSKYGSLNMVITYLLFGSMFLNPNWIKKNFVKKFPLILPFSLILFSYALSFSQVPIWQWKENIIYLIMLASNLMLFYMVYFSISTENDFMKCFHVLIVCNLLVIIYCFIQISLFELKSSLSWFGEITMLSIDPNKLRIVGPFNAVGITAEYIVIQILLLMYYTLFYSKHNKLLYVMIFINFGILIGTGNRGGLISIVFGFIIFLLVYLKKLHIKKALIVFIFSLAIFLSISYIVINFTTYNVIFDRLFATEMDGFAPDTRKGWYDVLELIPHKLILGHGPSIIKENFTKGVIRFYPHNLYIFILYTLGTIGFLAYTFLGITYINFMRKIKINIDNANKFFSGLPNLGIIIFFVIIFDQMKIEFLREALLDYQHYLSVLFAMFCSLSRIFPDQSGKSSTKTMHY